ncbi:MAG: protease complex subunit PrcB family protein [Lachnospiraceae bacterium]|nr:protease complex subunit PrcB family protein [Lachnospiraceae bacterium]
MKKRNRFWCILLIAVLLCGCSMNSEERIKLRDLDFTILSEEMIPQELLKVIEERKAESFKLTYSDKENLYIVIGYGQQQTGGYSITVNELYLTDNAIYINTSLLGPDASEKSKQDPSWPYIVIKTELLDQTVVFE